MNENDGSEPQALGRSEALDLSSKLKASGDLAGAEAVLLQALTRFPSNPWMHYQLAEVLIAKGEYESASDHLDVVRTDNPSLSTRTSRLRAALFLQKGVDFELAWELLDRAYLDDAGDDIRSIFRATIASRVRTNSLFSNWSSPEYTNVHAANHLVNLMEDAVHLQRPFSLVRLGDGEGGILAREHDRLNKEVRPALLAACETADILGLAREDMVSRLFRASISYLSERTKKKLRSGEIIVTDCHCHYALNRSPRFREFLSGRSFLGFIGGRELGSYINDQFTPNQFIGYRVPSQQEAQLVEHYPRYYDQLNRELQVPHAGAVFLVAAGVYGKIYCHWIKERGGIAIDIGAVADLWAGMNTRAYHALWVNSAQEVSGPEGLQPEVGGASHSG